MARKRDPVTEAAAAAAAAVAATQSDRVLLEEEEDAQEVTEDVLEGLRRLDQGENRVTWYVYSQTPGKSGNSEGYIEKLRSEQLDEQRFKAQYGPGEYRIVGRTRDGGYVKGSHKVVRISDIGAAATPGEGPADAVALLREMRASDEHRAQQRAESLKTTATILAAPLATVVAALIARRPSLDMPALITALRPQTNTLTEMTQALANLKQLEGGGGGHVDMVLKLLDRLQDLPTGGETGWLGIVRDVIKEAVPTVREFVGQMAQQSTQGLPPGSVSGPAFGPGVTPPPALVAPTNGQAAPAQVAQPAQVQSTMTNENPMFRAIEPWLRRKAEDLHEEAAANMPVELSAEHLLTSADKKFGIPPVELYALISRPEWWDVLIAFHPPLEPFKSWVTDVRQEILAMLEEVNRGVAPQQHSEQPS